MVLLLTIVCGWNSFSWIPCVIPESLSRGRRRVKEYAVWTYSMAGFINSMLTVIW